VHVHQASWWRLTDAGFFGMGIIKHDNMLLTLSERCVEQEMLAS
jgi:hypothetical protein